MTNFRFSTNRYIITAFFTFMLFFSAFSFANAATEDLIVTKVTRITPPEYRASNLWFGVRDIGLWNRDNTRMMIYESPHVTDPVSGKTGRGLVWGFISDFKSWTDVSDYENKIKPLPNQINWNRTDPSSLYWSIIPGEENIIYVTLENGWLVKLNVDTNEITNVISIDPGGGVDIKDATLRGWTTDNTLVMSFGYEDWSNGGYEINVQTPSRIFISSPPWDRCTPEFQRWPDFSSHGHQSKSPSGKLYYYKAGNATEDGVKYLDTCNFIEDMTYENKINPPYPWTGSHVSWKASENWFLLNSWAQSDLQYNNLTAPTLREYKLYQVYFDGVDFTYRELLSQMTAHAWINGTNSVGNWNAHFIATLRNDGKQALFTSTDGKYSYEDNQATGVTPWGFEGAFLVDFASTSTPPPTCTFTYSNWSQCQPNNTQTRTIDSQSPTGCTGGNPILTQSCTYAQPPAHTILKTTVPPTIDGNLSEYANANSITFSPATGGNTATVKVLWDSQALYIAYDVTDSNLISNATTQDGSVWADDSVEWFIDTLNNDGGSQTVGSYMLTDDYHGIVNTLNIHYDSQGTISGQPTSSYNGNWISAVKATNTGYTVEVKIPWTSINITSPQNDTMLSISFALNDNDLTTSSVIMWPNITTAFENVSNWKQAQLSGTIIVPQPILKADLNSDGTVNSLDWSIMNNAWGTADTTADINNDGIVNTIDFSILNGEWGM